MKIYFAAPLFSEAELNYNELVVSMIEEALPEVEIYVPQRNASINNKESHASPIEIVEGDDKPLFDSDILIALLDGAVIDEGVSAEVGGFAKLNRPIFGLYTDSRQQGVHNPAKIKELQNSPVSNPFMYRNNYVVGKIMQRGSIYSTKEDLIQDLVKYVNKNE